MKPLFAFDLDSTITRCELLPLIAQRAGRGEGMAQLTEAAMRGDVPFAQDFARRVELLQAVPLPQARAIVSDAPLNEEIAGFIRQNSQRCMIITGNLDVWIQPILKKLGMQGRCLCSRALVRDGRLAGIASILDKERACSRLARPFIAIGDGSNDIGMLRTADIGVAFGGVRRVSDALASAADMVVQDEKELVDILTKLL